MVYLLVENYNPSPLSVLSRERSEFFVVPTKPLPIQIKLPKTSDSNQIKLPTKLPTQPKPNFRFKSKSKSSLKMLERLPFFGLPSSHKISK